ncbi:hypothetical protein QTP70_025843, partial [Hemibagrus guttatus]
VLEGSWEFAQPVHMCFVDLEKAFDRVPRGILWEVLWEYGVRGPAVRSLYNRSRSLVRIASSTISYYTTLLTRTVRYYTTQFKSTILTSMTSDFRHDSFRMPNIGFQNLPLNIYIVVFGTAIFVFILSLLFCCYLIRLRHQAHKELYAYKQVIQKEKVKELNLHEICAVCLEEFKQKDELGICPCKHAFHRNMFYTSVSMFMSSKRKSNKKDVKVPHQVVGGEEGVSSLQYARLTACAAAGNPRDHDPDPATPAWGGEPGVASMSSSFPLCPPTSTLNGSTVPVDNNNNKRTTDTTDLEEYMSSVTSYISKCIDDVTISKSITTRSNQKPWMTAKVCALLKSRDSAFRAGDKDALRAARAKLSRAIREAKHTHSQRIHGHFQSSGDTRRMWQGTQSITNYRPASPACDSDASLPDVLNSFYARFEAQNDVMVRKTIPPPEDQFAYRPNRFTYDAITTTLHLALTHLDNKDSYVRMLFINFSSAFNTIIPQHLTEKLSLLGINTSLCNWILDFLTGRPQSVRIGTSSSTTLNTGAPQKCVLSPLLFTLLTHNCAAMHRSNHIIKFAKDDTTVVGLISKNDESAYREEVWCKANNLSLNVETSPGRSTPAPSPRKPSSFYRGTTESILSSCITVWFGNCTVLDRKTLQRIVRTAEKIIIVSVPSIMDIYSTRCIRKANSIVDDPTHPSHTLFTLLPSGKKYRSIRAQTSRLLNSFFPQAIRCLNRELN